jgi:DNA polymerase II small subunit
MKDEIIKFCMEKGLLLDNDMLELFKGEKDFEFIKLIIEKIRVKTQENIITKNIFQSNQEKIDQVFSELPYENQKSLENLKIKLGLSIEISRESSYLNENIEKIDEFVDESNVKILNSPPFMEKKLEVSDFTKYFRSRFEEMRNLIQEHSSLTSLVSINKISGNRSNFSIIGIVKDKSITKNKNIILEVEDFTGKIKVLINQNKKELYEEAEDIALDAVLGFNGSGNNEIFFVNEIIFPESRLSERKSSPKEEYALFIGDLHYGSKKFLKNGFNKFIDYLNELSDNEISKIKYLFLVGDIVTGVGNYPNQEFDLEINDLEEQFTSLANFLGKIRKDIKIIISPGNHDGVRIMEPQPLLNEKYAWALYDMENVIITSNPCYVNIGFDKKTSFSGWDVLTYHGFSFPYYAGNIPSLIKKKAMNCPEEIMKFLLKNRHLAPTHGSTQYYPLENDFLLIKKIPDIFVSAHTHKCGVSYYNNILIVSVSCWEAMTPYQEKFGNKPDHCKVPMVNLKTRAVKILDFEDVEETENKRIN